MRTILFIEFYSSYLFGLQFTSVVFIFWIILLLLYDSSMIFSLHIKNCRCSFLTDLSFWFMLYSFFSLLFWGLTIKAYLFIHFTVVANLGHIARYHFHKRVITLQYIVSLAIGFILLSKEETLLWWDSHLSLRIALHIWETILGKKFYVVQLIYFGRWSYRFRHFAWSNK